MAAAETLTALSAIYGAVQGGRSKFPSEAEHVRQEFQRRALRSMPSAMAEGALKAGIHPLAMIGAGGMQGTTVPMSVSNSSDQSNLTNMLYKLSQPQDIDEQIKKESLAALRRESKSAKWDYSLLIPVTHPHAPGKTFWGFNPKYQMYGSLAQGLVIAANKDEAFELLLRDAPPTEKQKLQQLKKRIQSMEKKGIFKDKQSNEYGTDIAP